MNPLKYYFQQTGHGSHCLCKVSAFKDIHLEEELWLEDTRYALPEDQVMFYKLYLYGYKTVYSPKTVLIHLDGAEKLNRENESAFASGRNFLIFWYRFIYSNDLLLLKKLLDIIAILYRMINTFLLYIFRLKIKSGIYYCRGILNGLGYIIKNKRVE